MKVIKKLGNNAAICLDGHNHELIAIGLGIGFPQCPYELKDLSKIDRTFYDVDTHYLNLFADIDSNIFEISADIIDLATTMLSVSLNPNAVFTLADHINFMLIRMKKGMIFTTPLSHEIKDLYPLEYRIAKHAIVMIEKTMKYKMPEFEIYGIAINIINSEEVKLGPGNKNEDQQVIKDITHIIKTNMNTKIDLDSFNYSRFVSHVQYLLQRKNKNTEVTDANRKLLQLLKQESAQTYQCVLSIKDYMFKTLNWNIGEDEILYLMLHVNRLQYSQ